MSKQTKVDVRPDYKQEDIVIKHLDINGSITGTVAKNYYNIGRIGSVVSKIRHAGYPVSDAIKIVVSGNIWAHNKNDVQYVKKAEQ